MQALRSERTLGKNDSECSFTLTDDEDRENHDAQRRKHGKGQIGNNKFQSQRSQGNPIRGVLKS